MHLLSPSKSRLHINYGHNNTNRLLSDATYPNPRQVGSSCAHNSPFPSTATSCRKSVRMKRNQASNWLLQKRITNTFPLFTQFNGTCFIFGAILRQWNCKNMYAPTSGRDGARAAVQETGRNNVVIRFKSQDEWHQNNEYVNNASNYCIARMAILTTV